MGIDPQQNQAKSPTSLLARMLPSLNISAVNMKNRRPLPCFLVLLLLADTSSVVALTITNEPVADTHSKTYDRLLHPRARTWNIPCQLR